MLTAVLELIWLVTVLRDRALIRKEPLPRLRERVQTPADDAMVVKRFPGGFAVESSTTTPG